MAVEITGRGPGKKVPNRRLKKIAQAILDIMGRSEAELSLALIGNAEMRTLNARYRNKDYPTDVLSFPVEGDSPGVGALLGDVIISVDKARQQALERGHTEAQEIVALLIHGIVHLLGYDHERSTRDALAMKRQENKIRRELCERGLLQV